MTLKSYVSHETTSLKALMIKGASGTLLLKVFYAVATFSITIILTRILETEQFGLYSFTLSWVLLIGIVAKAGMGQLLTKNIAAYYGESDFSHIKGILQFSFFVVASISILLSLGAIGISYLLVDDSQMRAALCLALVLIPLQALLVPASGAQSGFQQVVKAQLPILLIQPSVFIILLLTIWIVFPDIISTDISLKLLIIATTIALFSAIMFLKKSLPNEVLSAEPIYEVRKWSSSALPLVLAGGMFIVNFNADIIMLGFLADMESIGIYKAATRLSELVVFALVVINTPLSPLVARLYTAGEMQTLQKTLRKSAFLSFLLGLPLVLVFLFFGTCLMMVFGSEYSDGAIALGILSIGQLVLLASGPAGIVLVMTGNERKFAAIVTFSALINIVLNGVFISTLGINGAALATAISTTFFGILLIRYTANILKLNTTVFKIRRQ